MALGHWEQTPGILTLASYDAKSAGWEVWGGIGVVASVDLATTLLPQTFIC